MICYDISNPKRLKKTAKILEQHGIRIQKSFFQCEMTEKQKQQLIQLLLGQIDTQQDRLSVYPICSNCARNPWRDGKGHILKLENFEIL